MEALEDIIEACLNGNEKAERQLYDLHKTRWYMLSMRYSNSRDEANDIMQEGLIQVYKDLHQFDSSKSKFTTWSSRVIVHAALKYLKKTNWENSFANIEHANIMIDEEQDVYTRLASKELTEMVQRLPLGYRIIFNMFVMEGYSHIEIADQLGIAVGTSKSQLSKAKRMLRVQLERQINSYSNG